MIIIFLAFAGIAFVGHKLYNLRKQRIEEKKQQLIDDSFDSNEEDEE